MQFATKLVVVSSRLFESMFSAINENTLSNKKKAPFVQFRVSTAFVDRASCSRGFGQGCRVCRSNRIESSPEAQELSASNGQIAARLVRVVFSGGRKLVRDPAESILILRMASWVAILSLLVKLQPLPRALKLVSIRVPPDSKHAPAETEKRLGHAIDLLLGTNLLVFKPICWKRAAVLHRYLALQGIATQIVFGMRKTPEGAVDGHAWLEIGGKPILETTIPNYKVTYAFPSHETCNLDLSSLTSPVKN